MKYNQQLPADVEEKLDAYIERIKNIKWFKPDEGLQKSAVNTKVEAVLSAFGVEAKIEYRSLKIAKDYDAAWDAARDAAWDAISDAAWDAALDATSDAARDAAWNAALDATSDAAWDAAWDAALDAISDAARDAAWGAAWGALDVLASCTDTYVGNTPFLKLVDLWELGMYPVGVVNGVFIVYSPKDFAEEVESKHVPKVIIDGIEYVPKN